MPRSASCACVVSILVRVRVLVLKANVTEPSTRLLARKSPKARAGGEGGRGPRQICDSHATHWPRCACLLSVRGLVRLCWRHADGVPMPPTRVLPCGAWRFGRPVAILQRAVDADHAGNYPVAVGAYLDAAAALQQAAPKDPDRTSRQQAIAKSEQYSTRADTLSSLPQATTTWRHAAPPAQPRARSPRLQPLVSTVMQSQEGITALVGP